MQATLVSEGNKADYTPAAAVAAGDVVVQGSLVGMAHTAIAASVPGAINTGGIFDVVKATGAITAGAPVYWDATGDPVGGTAGSGAATTTAASNTLMGWAVTAAVSAGTTVRIKLANVNGATIYNQVSQPIADPGDAGAVPVTNSGYCPLVSAGAETRTVAAPSAPGQMLLLYCKTYVGAITVTIAATVNQTGNNTLVFGVQDDSIMLVAIESGAALEWRIAYNDGVVLSTV